MKSPNTYDAAGNHIHVCDFCGDKVKPSTGINKDGHYIVSNRDACYECYHIAIDDGAFRQLKKYVRKRKKLDRI